MMGGVCNLNSSQIDIDNDVTVELFEIDPDSLIMILTEFTIISSSKQYCNCNSIWTGGGEHSGIVELCSQEADLAELHLVMALSV